MIGKSHLKVVSDSINFMDIEKKSIFLSHREAIEIGLEIPDRYMIWERDPSVPAEAGIQPKKLVHRFYMDDKSNKFSGELIEQIWTYTEGIQSFQMDIDSLFEIYEDWENIIENFIMHLCMLAHFLADLSTPLHVGSIFHENLITKFGKSYHDKIENRIWNLHKNYIPQRLILDDSFSMDKDYLLTYAKDTYNEYLKFETIIKSKSKDEEKFILKNMSEKMIDRSTSLTVQWLDTTINKDLIKVLVKHSEKEGSV